MPGKSKRKRTRETELLCIVLSTINEANTEQQPPYISESHKQVDELTSSYLDSKIQKDNNKDELCVVDI